VYETVLGPGPGAKSRKDQQHRRAIIHSVVSHIVAWRSYRARSRLLAPLGGVKDATVFKGLVPVVSPLLSPSEAQPETEPKDEEALWLSSLDNDQQSGWLRQVIATLGVWSSAAVNEGSDGWRFLLSLTETVGLKGQLEVPVKRPTELTMQRIRRTAPFSCPIPHRRRHL